MTLFSSSGVGVLRLRFQFWILSVGKPQRLSISATRSKGRIVRSFSRVSMDGFKFVVLGFRAFSNFDIRGFPLGFGFCFVGSFYL